MTKKRIDQLLVERGLAETRRRAQSLLIAGKVLVNEQKVEKAGRLVEVEAEIRLLGGLPFVSRAGGKLQAALEHFRISVSGRVCADLGASTGGFTDCLLQNGAREVHCFDVGKSQLAWKLRTDPRVEVIDGFNVRNITAAELPEGLSVVTIDLSFISLAKVLPSLRLALADRARECGRRERIDLVLLVKPQFEVGKGEVSKGGIVRDSRARERAVDSVAECARSEGFQVLGAMPSPIPGAKGNREFIMYLQLSTDL